jgi:predicted ATP-grasp superfamily ATP-dependent carboligase
MKVYVFEYVTGGGFAGSPLPISMAREADLMVRTLVGELLELPGIQLRLSRDSRLPPVQGPEPLPGLPGEDLAAHFARGVAWADAAWPTAPETGGVLEGLAGTVLHQGKVLLGCRPEAIRLASSKRDTARALTRAGVAVIPTFGPGDTIPPLPGRWVVKPDDGAGGDGIRQVTGWREAREAIAGSASLVAQPWVEGVPASLSLLCTPDGAHLLAANRQRLRLHRDRPLLHGVQVNAFPDTEGVLGALGSQVARAIPGLWGYTGVDFVFTARGPVVAEVNPRLTTSYCGLRAALGVNVAATVLGLLEGGAGPWPVPASGVAHEVMLERAADD